MSDFDVDIATGAWLCETTEPHTFDLKLATALLTFFREEDARDIIDMGCGSGAYVDFLNTHGFNVVGIDGNPNTNKFHPCCSQANMSEALSLRQPPFDWVLCLEVGEHIPPQYEEVFLNNLERNCTKGVVLSWFPEEGHGIGHFNPRENDYVKQKMLERGFLCDEMAERNLRAECTHWWFISSLMVFKRP